MSPVGLEMISRVLEGRVFLEAQASGGHSAPLKSYPFNDAILSVTARKMLRSRIRRARSYPDRQIRSELSSRWVDRMQPKWIWPGRPPPREIRTLPSREMSRKLLAIEYILFVKICLLIKWLGFFFFFVVDCLLRFARDRLILTSN